MLQVGLVNKIRLQEFLLQARIKTYSSGGGKVKSAFPDMKQLEYQERDWLYRDIYNLGNGIFMGLETVYFKDAPILSISYFGNFSKVSEEEADKILRGALMEKWDEVRLWHNVKWEHVNYLYTCQADTSGSIEEFSGTEEILKNNEKIYYFYYAGGFIG